MNRTDAAAWQPLSLLAGQFRANVAALRSRMPGLADQIERLAPAPRFIATAGDALRVAAQTPAGLQVLPDPAPPSAARRVAAQLYPSGHCTHPAMVAGLGQGWIWQALYEMPPSVPSLPGHRPALFFLTGQIEQLWTAMHLHDWRKLLADERVRLFVGADAVAQVKRAMVDRPQIPWPRIAVTVEPSLWPAGESIDALNAYAQSTARERIDAARRQSDAAYAWARPRALCERLRSGQRLRILGITSRFTTFLQHSMRDWLDAFARLGHETRLVLERADHEALNTLNFSETIAEFRPDLLVLIDHYRGEFRGIPDNLPVVMWVQDHLPHIFSPKAGAAQLPRDYALGFGRLVLAGQHGYPSERFMPAQVGVNEHRFAPRALTAAERAQFGCDVSFVGHASVPADVIVAQQLETCDDGARRLVREVFDRLRAVYDAGGFVTQPILIRQLIEQAAQTTRTRADAAVLVSLLDFFTHRVNNALFRHQALEWVADTGADLRLYGRGWEAHPRFARFARGVADNQTQLSTIYQASRVNLQITPHGAVHQRLLEGLAAGGFFLIRYCPGDLIEPIYERIYNWCRANGVRGDEQIMARATPEVRRWLRDAEALVGVSYGQHDHALWDVLQLSADGDYIRSAASVWPEYGQVSFDSADALRRKLTAFLADEPQRRAIAASMRRAALERFSYTSTTGRLIGFIAGDLERQARSHPTEAAA